MLIYFLAVDRAAAEAEADSLWRRIAINRWATPERDDIRIVTHMRDTQSIPGGTFIMPAASLNEAAPDNANVWAFKELVDSGAAQWLDNPTLGNAATKVLTMRIRPPPAGLETFVADQGPTVSVPRDQATASPSQATVTPASAATGAATGAKRQ